MLMLSLLTTSGSELVSKLHVSVVVDALNTALFHRRQTTLPLSPTNQRLVRRLLSESKRFRGHSVSQWRRTDVQFLVHTADSHSQLRTPDRNTPSTTMQLVRTCGDEMNHRIHRSFVSANCKARPLWLAVDVDGDSGQLYSSRETDTSLRA